MLIQRKVAQVIWGSNAGKPDGFDKFWPLPSSQDDENKKVWGSIEEAAELRKQIEKAHGIKLS